MGKKDTLFSELVFQLNGADKSAAEFAEFFDLVSDCLDNPQDSMKRSIAFATAVVLREQRFDVLDGSILEDESWASAKHGYVCIMAELREDHPHVGLSLWYHPEEDILIFQHNFFKD